MPVVELVTFLVPAAVPSVRKRVGTEDWPPDTDLPTQKSVPPTSVSCGGRTAVPSVSWARKEVPAAVPSDFHSCTLPVAFTAPTVKYRFPPETVRLETVG